MTMLAAAHFGDHVLLAADTRITWCPIGRPPFTTDGKRKIQKTSAGYIAGAGASRLVDAVSARLREKEITHTSQVLDIVRAEYAQFRESVARDPAWLSARYEATRWLMTYHTVLDSGSAALRLAHIPVVDTALWQYPPGAAVIVAPFDLPDVDTDRLGRALNDAAATTYGSNDSQIPIIDRVEKEMHALMSPFLDVARTTSLVSREFDVAIANLGGVGVVYRVRLGSGDDIAEVEALSDDSTLPGNREQQIT